VFGSIEDPVIGLVVGFFGFRGLDLGFFGVSAELGL